VSASPEGLTRVTDVLSANPRKPSPRLEGVKDLQSDPRFVAGVPTAPLSTMKKDGTGNQSVDLRLCPLSLNYSNPRAPSLRSPSTDRPGPPLGCGHGPRLW